MAKVVEYNKENIKTRPFGRFRDERSYVLLWGVPLRF